MDESRAHRQPSEVFAEAGNIIIEGPNGVAVTMSLDAAEETGRRLLKAVAEARGEAETAPD